ncbi:type II secretion system F family protein [Lentibacillus sediminis]|uniref:type II secretion system F family protein n=1 Tax=Lentibacillus sediminis TaxID=1940529 RepID=UPI000C1BDFB5|nr:type II secretion system F family protein [Lentibacillus sediminis]
MEFDYSGKTLSGQRKKGKIDAASKREALFQLESEGLVIVELGETKSWNQEIVIHKKVNIKDFVLFLRQYSTLIHAGVPISEATKTMMEQTESRVLENVLADVDKQLDQGQALSAAAERHPKIFPPLLINMIVAGEASGRLDEILEKMASYYEKSHRNRQKVISALLYPTIVGIITIALSIFLLTFVVPQFVNMFASMGEEIPAFTQFVLTLSDWAVAYWWTIIALFLLGWLCFRYLKRYDGFVYQVDRLKLNIPFLGVLVHKGTLVRMTQTLSTLVNSSVPILQAVEITERVAGNRVIEAGLARARKALETGESMATPLREDKTFPPLVVQMVDIGEKTGTLDQMLAKAAEFYEEEVEQLSNRIKVLIEPLMIIVLTVIVGGIIAAVALPMFSMFENF